MNHRIAMIVALTVSWTATGRSETPVVLLDGLRHLRAHEPREWSDFPETADATAIELTFDWDAPDPPHTLRWRQQDVKQTWRVLLNDVELSRLMIDENDQVRYAEVPADTVRKVDNRLRIEQQGTTPDDIRVGELILDTRPINEILGESRLTVQIRDLSTGALTPGRITILNASGALQTVAPLNTAEAEHLAMRAGVVYTANGTAELTLPAGQYTVYAGRGFEYSLARNQIRCDANQTQTTELSISRVVATPGYVACDTHVHTLTFSGHGDATALERVITIAGEGIELPIATDHNRHIDLEPFARQANVRNYFTPVVGNEVTTRTGHFNAFPIDPSASPPDHTQTDWRKTLDGIFSTPSAKVAILNHARDLHSGTRPFGPKLFNDAVGINIEQWPMDFNAMEVVNSGATQSDPLQLFHDWMTLLNRGLTVTPVGSSDSHDVARHFVGQGRTLIRCPDDDPGRLNVDTAVQNFLEGHVMVSYGLLVQMHINGQFTSGDLATQLGETIDVNISVSDPGWTRADRLLVYSNGELLHEFSREVDSAPATGKAQSEETRAPSVWKKTLTGLPRPSHDVHLVAIATGPGVTGLFWPTAKSYQPTTPDWQSMVLGCSGAVWIDADGDGKKLSACELARRVIESVGDDAATLHALAEFDSAVAAQAAALLDTSGTDLRTDSFAVELAKAAPQVRDGFARYLAAWRANQIAKAQQ